MDLTKLAARKSLLKLELPEGSTLVGDSLKRLVFRGCEFTEEHTGTRGSLQCSNADTVCSESVLHPVERSEPQSEVMEVTELT